MIDKFEDEYRFLSNFYLSTVTYEGKKYPTIEHAYQAAKSIDPVYREKVAKAITPAIAKNLGKKAKLRPDWEDIKIDIMEYLIDQKFKDPELRDLLLATKPHELVEGNWWGDTFWGVYKGKGLNWLGKLLMIERDTP